MDSQLHSDLVLVWKSYFVQLTNNNPTKKEKKACNKGGSQVPFWTAMPQ